MKYATLSFNATSINNIGDNIQLIALDGIYKNEMHLSSNDIVYISKNDLDKYDGEPVLFPISLAIVDFTTNGWAGRFSKKIKPLFLGLSIAKDFLNPAEVDFFKQNEPVGCRDERTYRTMQSYGIVSYLAGCITLTLPDRPKKQCDKIFCVDLNETALKNLPDFLKKDAVITTHMIPNVQINPKDLMEKQYEMYKNEAKVVITSLLHCAAPCIAAGIPVICVKDVLSYRFGWIDKILKLYRSDEVSSITEIPEPIDVSYVRKLMTDLAVKRLKEPSALFPEMEQLTNYWLDRKKKDYVVDPFLPFSSFIKENLTDRNKAYRYSIWGLTQISEMVVEFMKKNYPQSELTDVYDKYRNLRFYGKEKKSPSEIKNDIDFLFVTTNAATLDALEMIKNGVIEKEKVCLMKLYR